MRFSSIFQLAAVPLQRAAQPDRARTAPAGEEPPQAREAPVDLPEDLDARVRLVGEWQLGEG